MKVNEKQNLWLNQKRGDFLNQGQKLFDEFKIEFKTPPSELVEITCTLNASAGSYGQDILMSLSNHTTYASSNLTNQASFENSLWNPPGRGTNNQATARWIVQADNLEAIGSNNDIFIAARCDNTLGTPIIKWGGNAAGEFTNLYLKATALPATIVVGS